jgi:hypothetical protein
VDRLPGLAVPDHGGFALVGDTAGDHVLGLEVPKRAAPRARRRAACARFRPGRAPTQPGSG